ncbi:hypothetical protein I308_102798 [Cryptococcus tetragattii IND107]|uniref:Secreted protein n=1 Tax=Cryptococcus tetragattii IND107 TaxID=1296105 RepID=A0ABR3BUK5_9TREE
MTWKSRLILFQLIFPYVAQNTAGQKICHLEILQVHSLNTLAVTSNILSTLLQSRDCVRSATHPRDTHVRDDNEWLDLQLLS